MFFSGEYDLDTYWEGSVSPDCSIKWYGIKSKSYLTSINDISIFSVTDEASSCYSSR